MADSEKRDPEEPKTQAPDNGEPIIDLVDEVGDADRGPGFSDLEKNLLDLERAIGVSLGEEPAAEGETAFELPEIPDIDVLGGEDPTEELIGSEAEEQPPAHRGSGAATDSDIDWLFQELGSRGSHGKDVGSDAALGGVTDITEFDEEFLEAEEIDDDDDEPLGLAQDHATEEDEEGIELLDFEEEEADNEIVWLDEIAAEAAGDADDLPAISAAPDEEGRDELAPGAAAQPAETGGSGTPDPYRPQPPPLAAAAVAPLLSPVGWSPQGPESDADPLEGALISPEQIEAAVERIIDQKFAGRIEAIILQAIEKAVSREIERLKRALLENDPENDLP
jgi:hypothetical protein